MKVVVQTAALQEALTLAGSIVVPLLAKQDRSLSYHRHFNMHSDDALDSGVEVGQQRDKQERIEDQEEPRKLRHEALADNHQESSGEKITHEA